MAPSAPWGAIDIIVNPQGGTGFGESSGKARHTQAATPPNNALILDPELVLKETMLLA